MKNNISSRHRGDLGGRFQDTKLPAKVIISMSYEASKKPIAQHLAWMLLNLLARQSAEIQEIELNIPTGIVPIKRLSPLISREDDLIEGLREGINKINPEALLPKENACSVVSIRIGPGTLLEADFSLVTSADGWSSYVGQESTEILGDGANPIGSYIAAALSTAEVFKFVRSMREDAGKYARRLWFDAYHFQLVDNPVATPKLSSEMFLSQTTVAGVGAVANGFLQTFYSLPNVSGEITIIDGDKEGICETNLNRYVLFGLPHIKEVHLKASTVKAMFNKTNIKVNAFDGWWQEWREQNPYEPLEFVISAVDKNSARHAIQDALPQLILGASTNEMRVQVNLYDLINNGPCLKCRNKIEKKIPDEVIINHLGTLSPERLEAEAKRLDIDVKNLKDLLSDPHTNCGKISGAALQRFASSATDPEWSVGFVSLMAGVLLAAEYLKNSSKNLKSALTVKHSMFRFQFWRPENSVANTTVHLPPEDNCFCQGEILKRALLRAYPLTK